MTLFRQFCVSGHDFLAILTSGVLVTFYSKFRSPSTFIVLFNTERKLKKMKKGEDEEVEEREKKGMVKRK
jgi:hypothetical protein